jgi:hypothetical protein
VPVAKKVKSTTSSSMSTAFAFVSAENEESYTWALQAYEGIVPYRDKNRFKPDPDVILHDGAEYIGHGIKAVFAIPHNFYVSSTSIGMSKLRFKRHGASRMTRPKASEPKHKR